MTYGLDSELRHEEGSERPESRKKHKRKRPSASLLVVRRAKAIAMGMMPKISDTPMTIRTSGPLKLNMSGTTST